jgi:hypothetical protein
MEKLFVNGSMYKRDIDTKTIYLNANQLNLKDYKILKMGNDSFYHIGYNSIKQSVKDTLKLSIKNGYNVIFEHDGKKLLLLFNK